MKTIDKVCMIANNALYFDNNSDYSSALWEILEVVKPELFQDQEDCPLLDYIEDEE